LTCEDDTVVAVGDDVFDTVVDVGITYDSAVSGSVADGGAWEILESVNILNELLFIYPYLICVNFL
jgi:hypothetical protein